jgi:hypothetical protein
MRYIMFGFLLLALSACGSTSSVKLAIKAPEKTSFEFRDERPPEDKHSRMMQGPSGAKRMYGDDALSPSVSDILRATLQERMGVELKGKLISLRAFDVSVTEPNVTLDQKALDTSSAHIPVGSAAAPISDMFIFGIESAKSLKTVTIEIRGTLDGLEFYSLVLDEYSGRVTEDDIRTSMTRLLDKVTQQLQRMALGKS